VTGRAGTAGTATAYFDRDSGRLRLSPELFEAFYDWAEGERADGAGLRALVDAGVLSDGQPHPAVAPLAEAIADPVCMVSVRGAAVDGSGVHGAGWLGAESAALLLDAPEVPDTPEPPDTSKAQDAPDGLVELACLVPVSVPAAVARVVGLGPRPVPGAVPVPLPAAEVDGLFGAAPEELSGAAPHDGPPAGLRVLAAVGASTADGARWWEVATRWPDASGNTCTGTLRVLDTADGLWAVTGADARTATLTPVSSTAAWRLLLRSFPS